MTIPKNQTTSPFVSCMDLFHTLIGAAYHEPWLDINPCIHDELSGSFRVIRGIV